MKPKRDGELYIYLNKPVLGLWGYESLISDWIGDTGQAKITIENLVADAGLGPLRRQLPTREGSVRRHFGRG